MSPRLWQHRISDIIEAIEKIQLYVKDMNFEAFEKNTKTIDAVIRNFIVIGEAVRNVLEKMSTRYSMGRGMSCTDTASS